MTRPCEKSFRSFHGGNFGPLAVVLVAMEALALPLPEPSPQNDQEIRRFSSDGVVIIRDSIASVYIGGTLINAFDIDDDDRGPRNVLAGTPPKTEKVHPRPLAPAPRVRGGYLPPPPPKEGTSGPSAGGVAAARPGPEGSTPGGA